MNVQIIPSGNIGTFPLYSFKIRKVPLIFLNEDSGREKDAIRDEVVKGLGLTVLRFSDREVFGDTEAVMEKIWSYS